MLLLALRFETVCLRKFSEHLTVLSIFSTAHLFNVPALSMSVLRTVGTVSSSVEATHMSQTDIEVTDRTFRLQLVLCTS